MSKITRRMVAVLALTPCFLLSGHDARPVVVNTIRKGVSVVTSRFGHHGQAVRPFRHVR